MISPRNAVREAERALGRFVLKKGLVAVVMGGASMLLLRQLARQKKEQGGVILLFEADELLATRLFDLFPDVYNEVFLITRLNLADLPAFIEAFDIEHFLGYRIFKNTTSVSIASDFYLRLETDFKKTFASRFSDLFTRLEFEPRWMLNSLAQIALFDRAMPVSRLFDTGRGKTAALISTGPSLREGLPFLRRHRDRLFIACVDSAYRILHRSGITPDLIISLDSQPFTIRHFLGLPLGRPGQKPALYADLVANPQVTTRWQGPLYFGLTAQYLGISDEIRAVTPGSDFVEDLLKQWHGDSFFLGDIQSGGSVATSLFDLLRQMNFDNLLLVGQDLAYTNREIHCVGTHHTDIWLSKTTNRTQGLENINNQVVKKRHITMVRTASYAALPEDYILSLYKQWLSEAAAKVDFKVFNLAQAKLPIENCLPLELDALASENNWQVQPTTDFLSSSAQSRAFLQGLQKMSFAEVAKVQFMQKVGRKHRITALRRAMQGEETQEHEAKQQAEQQLFFAYLQRRVASWLQLL